MIAIRPTAAVMALAAAFALPGPARAEDAAPPAEPAASVPSESPAAAAPRMGMGPGMGMGPMAADRCPVYRPGMMGMNKPSRMTGGDEAGKRIDMLEKRLDAMQLTLELLVLQQAAGVSSSRARP